MGHGIHLRLNKNESGEREHEQNGTDRGGRGRRRRGQEGHRAGIERLFQHGAGDLETERQGTDPWLRQL